MPPVRSATRDRGSAPVQSRAAGRRFDAAAGQLIGRDPDAKHLGESGQFAVSDNRDVETFSRVLRGKNLEPVFKSWDATYRD